MKLISKLKGAFQDPQKVYSLVAQFNAIRRRSNIGAALGYLSEKVLGYNLYLRVLRLLKCDTLVKIQLKDAGNANMYIDLNDEGISQDILQYGQREEGATKAFKTYLKPGQTIIDIGANIGYYVLIEATKVSPRGRIYAVEPEPHNAEILKRNVRLNQYSDIVDIECVSISDRTGTAKLHLANRSNLHTLTRVSEMDKYVKFKGTLDVQTFTLDDFLKYKAIDSLSIDIIRMDIEGHEVYALDGMVETLERGGPLIFFIEIHPKLIKQNRDYTYESFLRKLKAYGFKLAECFLSPTSRIDQKLSVDNIDDLSHFREAVEVILVRSH